MEIGINFKNIISYNENMAKGMDDKLFFLNKLNFKKDKHYLFVDFGCADGTLIDTLYDVLSQEEVHVYYIGYDISNTMIELAKSKFSHKTDNYEVLFTNHWDEVMEKVNAYVNMESVLILSSVIHEVYSYAKSQNDVSIFWDKVLNGNFNYICVRDMMISKDDYHDTNINIDEFIDTNFPRYSDKRKYWSDFEKYWGSIENNRNFIHYLLKYRWTINWEREVHENYLPIFIDDFLTKFSEKYNIAYLERFRIPFLEKCWKEDFDIELEDYTHIKLIFNKKHEANK